MSFYEYLESNVYWNGEKNGGMKDTIVNESIQDQHSKPFWTMTEVLP